RPGGLPAGRPRTHRDRLVGRLRRAPRLLRRRTRHRPARLAVPRSGWRRLDAAGLVRMRRRYRRGRSHGQPLHRVRRIGGGVAQSQPLRTAVAMLAAQAARRPRAGAAGRAGTRNRGRRARMGQRTRQPLPPYAELHCLSHFSFQRGASSAQELFERAKKLGYAALAITDECSLAGIVRALEASEETGVPLIVGSELTLTDGTRLVLLCEDQVGYASLCRLITRARRNAAKGEYRLSRAELEESRGD